MGDWWHPWVHPWLRLIPLLEKEQNAGPKRNRQNSNEHWKYTAMNIFIYRKGLTIRPFLLILLGRSALQRAEKEHSHMYCILPLITREVTDIIGTVSVQLGANAANKRGWVVGTMSAVLRRRHRRETRSSHVSLRFRHSSAITFPIFGNLHSVQLLRAIIYRIGILARSSFAGANQKWAWEYIILKDK